MQGNSKPSKHSFIKSVYQYAGYLKGVAASKHTVLSAQYDLKTFSEFLIAKGFKIDQQGVFDLPEDLIRGYSEELKKNGLKANSRRRALATLRRFLAYQQKRLKNPIDLSIHVEHAPKLEKVPETFDLVAIETKLAEALSSLRPNQSSNESPNHGQDMLQISHQRDLLILRLLITEGLNISEICQLKWNDFTGGAENPSQVWSLSIYGRHERTIRLGSADLKREMALYKDRLKNILGNTHATKTGESAILPPWVFFRFSKAGQSLSHQPGHLTERACEHSVSKAQEILRLEKLYPPRTFRHSVVLRWFKQGLTEDEIKERLGLRTKYAFRVFQPLLTSIEEV